MNKIALNKKRSSSGFTLVELIIVIIILGIMASVAIPKLVANISKGKAAEAYGILGSFATKAMDCLALKGATDFSNTACDTELEILGYKPASTNGFTYDVSAPGATITYKATNASGANDWIQTVVTASTGGVAITKGSGAYTDL